MGTVSQKARLRFEVEDTGIGIAESKLPLFFEPFRQLDASSTRRHGGAGLGLAIARRLVELMGGSMGVDSEAGRGSTFWLELTLPVAAGAAPSEAEVSLAGLRVLVFEDHPINQRLTLLSLGKLGCRTEAAPSGEAMLNRLKAEPWDAVVFAYALPDMPTAEFVGKLAPSQPGPPCPAAILCLLPSESSALRESLGRAGVHGFLPRPFTVEPLREALTHARAAAGGGRRVDAGLR